MSGRFDLRSHRDPRVGLRAERAKLHDEDVAAASELMSLARSRADAILQDAHREAEALLEAARATGRGIVAEAEAEAAGVRGITFERPERTAAPGGDPVDLNTATADDLRVAGLSITQARRVIARRERTGPYETVEQLAELPGMPSAVLARIRSRLRV